MKRENIIKLVVSLLACWSAGIISSFFIRSGMPVYYASLIKPSFTPPNWVFMPVWIFLFTLMAIALFLVWRKGWREKGVFAALSVFFVQLIINMLWSITFFGLRQPAAATAIVIILFFAIAVTMILFFRISKTAAALLLPYICWVGFSVVLNIFILRLNSQG